MAAAQPLLGLSLAPRLITVIELTSNRTHNTIVQIKGNDEYQSALSSLARQEKPARLALYKAIAENLAHVQVATNRHFNKQLEIPVVTLHPTINDIASKKTIKEAILDNAIASRDTFQYIGLDFAAHYVYNLGTAKGLGLDQGELDWDMGAYEALLIDYSTDMLSISLIDLAEHGCVIRETLTNQDLGSSAIHHKPDSNKNNDAQTPINADTEAKTQSHYASIRRILSTFVTAHTLPSTSSASSNTGSEWKPLTTDIRAVILSGDAPLADFDQLRASLREVLSSELTAPGWLKDGIEPKMVGAVGAAKRLQHVLGRPEDFTVHVQHVGHSHDEL